MKKIFLAFILGSALFSCKKETNTPTTNGNSNTIDTKNLSNKPTSGYGQNITDVDGSSYKTIYIGKQQWMAENLKTSKYSDGTLIPNITDNVLWFYDTIGAWANYNNDVSNNAKYGKLYNWYAVNRGANGNKNICPTGWHVPSYAEWIVLRDYLGGGSTIAGGKMKEVGTTNWNSPNTNASNTSLFTALPGGLRIGSHYNESYGFENMGKEGFWWSSNSSDSSTYSAWSFTLSSTSQDLHISEISSDIGLSVRCIKD